MRILITGGAGYVGSHTARRLHGAGHEVWVLDELSTGHRTAARAALPGAADRLLAADLRDAAAVNQLFLARRFEALVHCAASTRIGETVCRPNTSYRNNLAALRTRGPIEIRGTDYPTPDGTCIRDYVHIEDVAEAHVLALRSARSSAPSGRCAGGRFPAARARAGPATFPSWSPARTGPVPRWAGGRAAGSLAASSKRPGAGTATTRAAMGINPLPPRPWGCGRHAANGRDEAGSGLLLEMGQG
jgi:hypothetical protein